MRLRILVLVGVACVQFSSAQQSNDIKMNQFISELMAKMTLDEKIGQLNLTSGGGGIARGRTGMDSLLINGLVGATSGFSVKFIRQTQETAVTKSRLHIPLLFGLDVIHGYKTIFPIPLAMSTTWNPALIEKSARIAATEASANGICWTYSPMLDIARDPRWGRIAEGSGEDPYLGSLIARAMIKGYQGDDLSKENTIMACVKHFALYGAAEAGRDYNTVDMSHITMFKIIFHPIKPHLMQASSSTAVIPVAKNTRVVNRGIKLFPPPAGICSIRSAGSSAGGTPTAALRGRFWRPGFLYNGREKERDNYQQAGTIASVSALQECYFAAPPISEMVILSAWKVSWSRFALRKGCSGQTARTLRRCGSHQPAHRCLPNISARCPAARWVPHRGAGSACRFVAGL